MKKMIYEMDHILNCGYEIKCETMILAVVKNSGLQQVLNP